MTKRITILLTIMLLCLLCLLFLQGYLAYQEYRRQQRDFTVQVNALFAQSVQVEKAARLDQLVQLFMADLDNPELVRIEARVDTEVPRTIFDLFDAGSGALEMSITFDQLDLVADTMSAEVRRRFYDRMEKNVREDLSEESVVYWTERLAERLRRNFTEVPIDTAALRIAFRSKLDSAGIGSSFTVAIDTSFDTLVDGSSGVAPDPSGLGRAVRTAPVPLFGQSWIGPQRAVALIDNPGYTIFRRSLFTIAGSAAVLLLTLLSFYLLFATILRQKKLSEMKDDFIDNITHELQTPIATLRLAIDSLQDFEVTARPERFARYREVATAELNRLSEMVDGILQQSTAAEPGALQKEALDLMVLLREAADRHRLQAQKPVAVELPDTTTFVVRSSRFHLNTIIDNLLQNAIRYSADEGVRIEIRLERQAEGFVLEIADDGWGIAPEDRRQIFEKFYRSSNRDRNYTVKGLGIGLYHVRQCVEALGGRIRVRDNQPRGTVVLVGVGSRG